MIRVMGILGFETGSALSFWVSAYDWLVSGVGYGFQVWGSVHRASEQCRTFEQHMLQHCYYG